MPFVRRRPLLRAAAVGGVAYMGARAGTNRAMQQAAAQQPAGQGEPGPTEVAPAAAPASGAGDRIAQLQQVAQLHESGVLTDEEFAREKARVLG
jgi:hypothetical protein